MKSSPVVLFLIFLPLVAQPGSARPAYPATRVAKAPVIDADLSDEAWRTAPEISDFTQHDPDDGKPATQKTTVKVVYTDEAIYFGAFLEDDGKVTTLLGRRDLDLVSDWFRISIDSQYDRLTGAQFWVNPSNVQSDLFLFDDLSKDWSWDAVWSSAAKIVPGGWVAEVRIPFTQLRFPGKPSQTWGLNFMRRIVRLQEYDYLVNTPKGEQGVVSRFADLTNLDGIAPERTFEVVPYGVARSDVATRYDRANPFERGSSYRMDGGMDLKYVLTSNLMLTGTINPDFGQVEVDPAVVNLTEFETFFPEKRPFFTEGAQMFSFGSGPAINRWSFSPAPTFFYTRRIGRSPQGSPDVDYFDAPGETTILGAAKLTGKFGKGWSVGVLDAVTDSERALTMTGNAFERRSVEPMTNYFVGRAAKEFGKASRVGVLFTSVNRKLDDELSYLRQSAYLAGVDGFTLFRDKQWLFEWQGVGSTVEGSAEAIERTQESGTRYFQRPDADHVELDPTRTSLSGYGGKMLLAKQTGVWRPTLQITAQSPGLEINDLGFLQRADKIASHAVLHYYDSKTRRFTRWISSWAAKNQSWNFDGDLLSNNLNTYTSASFKNYWVGWVWTGVFGDRFDDTRTRGGPLVRKPSGHAFGAGFSSDSRKRVQWELWTDNDRWTDGSIYQSHGTQLIVKPTTALQLSVLSTFERVRDTAQYVATRDDPTATATFGKRYVFATVDQRTLDVGLRADWTLSARLSLQLFVQPFIASGDYHDFTELARAGSHEYTPYSSLRYDSPANRYHARDLSFANPDFNVRSVRGNAVVRWEFRPGSALYFIWNENRSHEVIDGDFRLGRDLRAIPGAPSRDVFLVKVSYWLPM